MKTKIIFFLFLLLSLYSCAKKQHEPLPSYGLLWRITGNGLKTPSYLFGTYHLQGGIQILDTIKNIDSIYNSTEQLLCESKNDILDFIKQAKNHQPNKLDELLKPWPDADSTYNNILTNKQKKILDSVLLADKILINIEKINFRPLNLMNFIKYSYSDVHKKPTNMISEVHNPANDTIHISLDLYLQHKAKKRNMSIVALDTEEIMQKINSSLLSNISQLSYKSEAECLMFYIENHSAIDSTRKAFISNLLSTYLKQDINSLMEMSKKRQTENIYLNNPILFNLENDFSDKYDKLMIDERNNNWMKKIPNLIAEKSCFIAVGAGHLPGEEGLINQLRDLGYTVIYSFKEKK